MPCQIYVGGDTLPDSECQKLTGQKIAADAAGAPQPTFLDHPSVINNTSPEIEQVIQDVIASGGTLPPGVMQPHTGGLLEKLWAPENRPLLIGGGLLLLVLLLT